jgi:hypothetical protein
MTTHWLPEEELAVLQLRRLVQERSVVPTARTGCCRSIAMQQEQEKQMKAEHKLAASVPLWSENLRSEK